MRRLLVVEDDLDIARALCTYGRHRGFDACAVHDGLKAIEIARHFRPNIVLLDVMLPRLDGRDVFRRLKAEGLLSGTLVIFLSARDEQWDRRVGLELGADDYETKPVHLGSLFKKIEYLLEKRAAKPAPRAVASARVSP